MQDDVRPLYRQSGLEVTDRLTGDTLERAEFIINKTAYIDDEFARQFPNLRAIVEFGTESWMIDLRSENVPVICLDEDRGYDVAEHTVALLLATIKRLNRLYSGNYARWLRRVLRRPFSRQATESSGAPNWRALVTQTLYRKKVGVVGYGLIGRQTHRRLEGFDCEMFYFDQQPYPAHIEARLSLTYLDLPQMFQLCDYIVMLLPHTPDTECLVSDKVLADCREDLVLINCGRAGVIDQQALYHALRRRQLNYYSADVFWQEPLPLFSRFRRLRNCWITPHSAESLPKKPKSMLPMAIDRILHFERSMAHV